MMNFGTWNVQGVSGKLSLIITEMGNLKMDVMALTKTRKIGKFTEKKRK